MHRITKTLVTSLVLLLIFASCIGPEKWIIPDEEVLATNEVLTMTLVSTGLPVIQPIYTTPEELMPLEDIELIALVTMAEAEGECEEGKRLVIDTILNRVDSGHFPDTVCEVIYQPNQFSPMWNGRVERCDVREDIVMLVREELESRTNYEVIFFTAGQYSKYGTPMFQVENHYFSSYN